MTMLSRGRRRLSRPDRGAALVTIATAVLLVAAPPVEAHFSRRSLVAQLESCTPQSVPREERCTYIREHMDVCAPEDGWVNYLYIHYCLLDQIEAASTCVFLAWIACLFALMLILAERFFVPSLELISEYLRLPPPVAGATLLAFGNGAPDVFTQLAAISKGGEGPDGDVASPAAISMALSEPLGSGLFVGNIVFGLVMLVSGVRHGVWVQPRLFLKDVLFYLGGVTMVLAFLLRGEVSLPECLLLAAYYLAYMGTTIWMSRGQEPVHADPRLHEVPHRPPPMDSFFKESFRVRDLSLPSVDYDHDPVLLPMGSSPEPTTHGASPPPSRPGGGGGGGGTPEGSAHGGGGAAAAAPAELATPLLGRSPTLEPIGEDDDLPASTRVLILHNQQQQGGGGGGEGAGSGGQWGGRAPPLGQAYARHASMGAGRSRRSSDGGGDKSWAKVLWRRMERPCLALLSMFMPRIALDDHARYRKSYAVLLPLLVPTLVAGANAWGNTSAGGDGDGGGPGAVPFWQERWWQAATAAGAAVSLVVVVWYPRKGHLHGWAAGMCTVVVFCEAMALLEASAGELVSAAVALGQIYGISPALLGATLLAWGNSVSDLVSNVTLAQDGLPSMAITACFASPMFTLLAGLVTSLTYATRYGTTDLPRDLSLRVLYGCCAIILVTWALVVPFLFRFRLSRRTALLAFAMYAIYQTVYVYSIIHDTQVGPL